MNEALMNGPQLKSALWDAANTLRGSAVDRTDWKGYILPLLFFKRISDVWDEETAEAQEIYGEADPSLFPEIHRFVVPEGCHWNDVRETATNVGAALHRAMQEIERDTPLGECRSGTAGREKVLSAPAPSMVRANNRRDHGEIQFHAAQALAAGA